MAVPVITSALRAGGNVGTPFTYTITASNSPTSFDAFLQAGGLPAGLAIDTATGILSGTPTLNHIYQVRIRATNSDGSDSEWLDLHISKAGAPVVTSAETASGTVGSPFTYSITGTNTPTGYNAVSLPDGLSVNTTTGAITGTPTTAGTFNSSVSAINSSGKDSDFVLITIVDGSGVPVITSDLTINLTVGDPLFSYQITATNTPTSFGCSPLPPGLTLDTATGIIDGTATTSGLYTSLMSATNGTGTGTATATFTVGSGIPGDQSGIPTGITVLIEPGKPINPGHLSNPNVDAFVLSLPWSQVEKTAGFYNFPYFTTGIKAASAVGKKVILKIMTGGGAKRLGGTIPDHVFQAMGLDPNSKAIVPGVSYTFNNDANVICIPVPWQTDFVTKKSDLYAALGDYITNSPDLTDADKAAVKVVHVAFANSIVDGWNLPHGTAIETTGGPDGTGYPLNERDRWLFATNAIPNPGAGYTSSLLINAGVSIVTAFLEAAEGKFAVMNTGVNGTELDFVASGGVDTTNYACKTASLAINTAFTNRFILKRPDVTAFMPAKSASSGTVWQLLSQWDDMGLPTAGEELFFVFGDTNYTMNNGVAGDYGDIYVAAGTLAASYDMKYLEVWETDANKQTPEDQLAVRALFFEGTLPAPPIITSPDTATGVISQPFTYQITADNLPTSFGLVGFSQEYHVDRATGLVTGRPVTLGDFTGTISATNAGGFDEQDLTITITDGGGSSGGPPPGSATIQVRSFPEVTTFSEDTKAACSGYEDLINQQPPNPPRRLVVTTPGIPGSGSATATWEPPLPHI